MISGTLRIIGFVIVLLAFLALPVAARAQAGPEGNAHPTQQLVSGDKEFSDPFGGHTHQVAMTPAAKLAFAASLDLSMWEAVPVFHNGRVKVLGTLARETVSRLTGRKNYRELPDEAGKEAAFSPLFTFFDLLIDPEYYLDKPIIGIDYLPLRRAILEAEFPQDERSIQRWLMSGRVTPSMVVNHIGPIADRTMDKDPWSRALNKLDNSMRLYMSGRSNLVLLAPETAALPWSHVSTLPDNAPVRERLISLGSAWRNADPATTVTAAGAVITSLDEANVNKAVGGRPALEVIAAKVNAFEFGMWMYCLALVALLLAVGTQRASLRFVGATLLGVALSLHAFGFITRCLIAERFAIQNQFESMTGVSLFAATVGFLLMIWRKQPLFGAAAAGAGFMVLIAATQTAIPGKTIEREAAILNTSVLLKYHVTTVLVSYGLISLGFILSLFYLGTHYLTRRSESTLALAGGGDASVASGDDSPRVSRVRALADLDTAQLIVLQLAFWTLGTGVLLGAWWADHSWGRWWAWDPKETWALVTWIIYLIVIHSRQMGLKDKGLTTAWLSIIGFIVMLWTYFGVNLLLPGLHAYA